MLLDRGLRRSSRGELRLVRPDGVLVPVLLSMNAVQIEGVGQTATAVISDLTELKVAQAALADAKDALEVRVLERTAKLRQEIAERERLATELAERDRRKDEFLAMLGHELRNPLAPIMNAMEMLRLRSGNPEDVERARLVVERQIRNMARLVDDLLDVSRITRGVVELRRERADLRAAVESAINACRSTVEVSQHQLELSIVADPCRMMGDATRLEQIVVNLISNACKYTPPGGRITVSLAREGDWAELSVRDTGRGIPPEMLPRIFDLFTQVDAPIDRSLGGLGIGLTIVRNLAELHGGTVHAESPGEGQGAEFLVRFPLLPSEISLSRPDRPHLHTPKHSLRILIVEDNVDTAETLAELLEIWGHTPLIIGHGRGAVDAALGLRPDVILLDIGLPGMDGYEVARLMRRQSELDGSLLVALTGYGQEDDRRRALAAGCDRHMTKPINSDQLQWMLASVTPDGKR
jgi:two-component system CheB/CheR fusion protein